MRIIQRPSPSFGMRIEGVLVNLLILHYTGMKSASEALDRLCDQNFNVSAHYLIDESGRIFCLVDENNRAWHAGVAFWGGEKDINNLSIGVEIVNPGHEFGYTQFPHTQMIAVEALCKDIIKRYSIPAFRVLAHSDVAIGRKQDPGELFDWKRLAMNGVGIWPELTSIDGTFEMGSITQCQINLKEIGYGLDVTGKFDQHTKSTIMAFQRHWLPHSLTGEFDVETAWRIKSILDVWSIDSS
jgi:N-acetylmuramoyl-L-alanine amidase